VKLLSDLSAQWAVINRLLDEALALEPPERETWLAQLPAEHQPLKETLRSLLATQAGIETVAFLDTLPRMSEPPPSEGEPKPGDEIGPYRIIELIGRGGQGAVWSAQRIDGQLKRKLALKLPRLTWAEGLAARMERERDILGALDHPNIARLYDAGVDQRGRPFLAIEHVDGVNLERYCDERRLDLSARVSLFMKILEAVQHAHTALVVHRDLKPANILVNDKGEPKLLDFGVSSLMDEAAAEGDDPSVRTAGRALTPRYASPEQISGKRLGLGSDIYSIGVVLYESLTGCSPYPVKRPSAAEYERVIADGELRPASRAAITDGIALARDTSPRKLVRALQGDLEAVLMRAMALDPRERYGTASALRDDLRRWLTGRPVQASPPSTWTSLRKFVVRNAWTVGGISLAVLAVMVAGLIAMWQAREARDEARRANATRDLLMGIFSDANPALHGGREMTARQLLESNESRLVDRLRGDPVLQADVLQSVASVWDRFGEWERVAETHERRVALLRDAGAAPEALARALLEKGYSLAVVNDMTRLAPVLDQVQAVLPPGKMPAGLRDIYEWQRGWLAMRSGRREAAIEHFTAALASARVAGNTDLLIRSLYGRSFAQGWVGRLAVDRDGAAARQDAREAARLLAGAPLDRADKADRRLELVSNLYTLGEFREGGALMQEQVAEATALFGEFSAAARPSQHLWLSYQWRLGRPQGALEWLAARERARAATPDDLSASVAPAARVYDIRDRAIEARLWLAVGRPEAAGAALQRGWALVPPERTGGDALLLALIEMEWTQQTLPPEKVLERLGERPWTDLQAGLDSEWSMLRMWHRGLALGRMGDHAGAIALLESALQTGRQVWGDSHPRTALLRLPLAWGRWRAGAGSPAAQAAARSVLETALPDLERGFPEDHPALRESRVFLAHLRGATATEVDLKRWRDPDSTLFF
jgi:serine/threonine protein kinase/tetratricopeptide (TPR) repeat protein